MGVISEVKVCQLPAVVSGLILALAVAPPSMAQEVRVTQVAGVDNTRMGAFRARALLSFQALQKGDKTTAAELARILEKTWDAAEEHDGETSLAERNESLFEQIDEAMDAFIRPVIRYATRAPDSTLVRAAYSDHLAKLKQGE
jgi:acyl-CoA reductase-like NAD-dependent aldehyde dehydrogenase